MQLQDQPRDIRRMSAPPISTVALARFDGRSSNNRWWVALYFNLADATPPPKSKMPGTNTSAVPQRCRLLQRRRKRQKNQKNTTNPQKTHPEQENHQTHQTTQDTPSTQNTSKRCEDAKHHKHKQRKHPKTQTSPRPQRAFSGHPPTPGGGVHYVNRETSCASFRFR